MKPSVGFAPKLLISREQPINPGLPEKLPFKTMRARDKAYYTAIKYKFPQTPVKKRLSHNLICTHTHTHTHTRDIATEKQCDGN